MSNLLTRLKADQLSARKARETDKASLLTTVISEASKISAEDHKKGMTEITDERVLRTLKSFVGNIDLALNGDPQKGIPAVKDEAALAKFNTERDILAPYIPQELSELELRKEISVMEGGPFSVKDTGKVKAYLESLFPGQINARVLSTVLKEGV